MWFQRSSEIYWECVLRGNIHDGIREKELHFQREKEEKRERAMARELGCRTSRALTKSNLFPLFSIWEREKKKIYRSRWIRNDERWKTREQDAHVIERVAPKANRKKSHKGFRFWVYSCNGKPHAFQLRSRLRYVEVKACGEVIWIKLGKCNWSFS